MPPATFDKMMKQIKPLHHNLTEVIGEIEAYRDLIVVRMKSFVDDRTKSIVQLASRNKSKGIKAIKDYTIHVSQTIHTPDADLSSMNLPGKLQEDTSTHNVFKGKNPYDDMVEEIENMKSNNHQVMHAGKEEIKFGQGNPEDQKFAIGQASQIYEPDNYDHKKRKLNLNRTVEKLEEKDIARKKYEMERRRRFSQKRNQYLNRHTKGNSYRYGREGLI